MITVRHQGTTYNVTYSWPFKRPTPWDEDQRLSIIQGEARAIIQLFVMKSNTQKLTGLDDLTTHVTKYGWARCVECMFAVVQLVRVESTSIRSHVTSCHSIPPPSSQCSDCYPNDRRSTTLILIKASHVTRNPLTHPYSAPKKPQRETRSSIWFWEGGRWQGETLAEGDPPSTSQYLISLCYLSPI